MRVVYQPENLIDAYLVKDLLEQDGVPVFVRGEHLLGGIGQLPAIGLLALCVPEPWAGQADATLQRLERERIEAAGVTDADGPMPVWA